MNEILLKQLASARDIFNKTKDTTTEIRKALNQKVKTLFDAVKIYDETWAGDWAQNTDVYDLRNSRPNPYLVHVNEDYIIQDLKKRTKIDTSEIKTHIKDISKKFLELKDFLLSELSFIKDNEALNNEAELLKQVEAFQWGISPSDYVRHKRPKSFYVYDPTIINRGLETPPHIGVYADLVNFSSLLVAYENFEKLAHRLLRQLEIKANSDLEINTITISSQQPLNLILDKFHIVVTQLRNRHNKKPTLIIEDEYDVQYLLNALLRINFEDVRKEDYIPSYAGGSTRVDFLLKREKILIEVKKTRDTLKDKEIGNQLIIDIAHYKSHPDCKHLVCFVYDPDNLVANPRGLEDDLNINTSDDMLVEVIIRP
jgi:hypothetical protein